MFVLFLITSEMIVAIRFRRKSVVPVLNQRSLVIQFVWSFTNTGGLCRFRYERFINFLTSAHSDTRRETQFLKVFSNHTMLTILYDHP